VVDSTAPTVTPVLVGTLGSGGWYTSDVELSWQIADPESAITSSAGCDAELIDYDSAGITFTCEAISEGGTTAVEATIRRDATAPIVDIVSPAEGAEYFAGEAVTVAWTASDALSGLAAPSDASAPDGAFLDTSIAGSFSFAVTATDAAGNATTAIHSYRVLSATEGAASLTDLVNALGLSKGRTRALTATLEGAMDSLDRGSLASAIGQLGAFVGQVEALRGKTLPDGAADGLVEAANRLIESIGTP
jgi:hypothetical protein